MKKSYIIPANEIVACQPFQLLDVSGGGKDIGYGGKDPGDKDPSARMFNGTFDDFDE